MRGSGTRGAASIVEESNMNTIRIVLLALLVVTPWNCPDAIVRAPHVSTF